MMLLFKTRLLLKCNYVDMFQIKPNMEAWVTLATNDDYAVGAITLAASLKRVKTSKKLVIMITNTVSENVKKSLHDVFDDVTAVEAMDSGDVANLALLDRTELGITFTKVKYYHSIIKKS